MSIAALLRRITSASYDGAPVVSCSSHLKSLLLAFAIQGVASDQQSLEASQNALNVGFQRLDQRNKGEFLVLGCMHNASICELIRQRLGGKRAGPLYEATLAIADAVRALQSSWDNLYGVQFAISGVGLCPRPSLPVDAELTLTAESVAASSPVDQIRLALFLGARSGYGLETITTISSSVAICLAAAAHTELDRSNLSSYSLIMRALSYVDSAPEWLMASVSKHIAALGFAGTDGCEAELSDCVDDYYLDEALQMAWTAACLRRRLNDRAYAPWAGIPWPIAVSGQGGSLELSS